MNKRPHRYTGSMNFTNCTPGDECIIEKNNGVSVSKNMYMNLFEHEATISATFDFSKFENAQNANLAMLCHVPVHLQSVG